MSDNAFAALKQSFLIQITWMQAHAEKLESGKCQCSEMDGPTVHNRSLELAEDFRHRANNLKAAVEAYERLVDRNS
jgi:hypothetical protein